VSADLKVLRQKYTTGARINYIPSSVHRQMGSVPDYQITECRRRKFMYEKSHKY
jgi:hypothetical protein